MIRVPVKSDPVIRVLGVDPGFASVGLSVVDYYNGEFLSIDTHLITTKKQDKKSKTNIRGTVDDQRRMREICDQLTAFSVTNPGIGALSVEAYTVSGPRAGNAWKAAIVYGGIMFWGMSRSLYVAPFLPMDLKRRFGIKGSSKEDVEYTLRREVKFFDSTISKYPKTKREHISDATGHAVLLIEEILNNRIMFGV